MELEQLVEPLRYTYKRTHDFVLKAVENLTEDQLADQPNSSSPSIAFHLWHLARYADRMSQIINGPHSQIWVNENLAKQWGYDTSILGFEESGTGMEIEAFESLHFPGKAALSEYARLAFQNSDEAVERLDAGYHLQSASDPMYEDGRPVTLVLIITSALTHNNRHLGMIEASKGFLGLEGSATS